MNNKANTSRYPELAAALKDVKSYFIYAGIFSAAVNMLMLVPVIYMLQVFNRVISSGSLSTLASLTLLMVAPWGTVPAMSKPSTARRLRKPPGSPTRPTNMY